MRREKMSKRQEDRSEVIEGKYCYTIEMGRTFGSKRQILDHLLQHGQDMKEVPSVEKCDFILVFCTISSRAGTDISAALKKLDDSSASKPAILVVLYHTFDPYKMIQDSSAFINRRNTLIVDCLFHEDMGLLKCIVNDRALARIVQRFKHQERSGAFGIVQLILKKGKRCYVIIFATLVLWSLYRWFNTDIEKNTNSLQPLED